MPNTKSAAKRLRQSTERREKNRSSKRAVRTQVRKVRDAVEAGDLARAQTELRLAAKKLDQAAAGKTIHRNAASRTKSRLAAAIKRAKAPKAGTETA
jgi:small subunit ribosomal protein S20